jgi:dTDP-4-amino-4,6-dideoxygalactose transaminase
MFPMLFPSLEGCTQLMDHLRKKGIQSAFHYLPLHLSRMGQQFGFSWGDFPMTEEVTDRLIRLPFYTDLLPNDQHRIFKALLKFGFD